MKKIDRATEAKILEMISRHEKVVDKLTHQPIKEDLRHQTHPVYAKFVDKMVNLAKKRAS